MKFSCPICKQTVEKPADGRGNPDFPFCCERCRLLDLGNWAAGKYRVRGPAAEELAPEAPPGDNPFGEHERDS